MEKDSYAVNESADYNNGHANQTYVGPTGLDGKTGRMQEAADLYGNVETAEEYGYVARGCVECVESGRWN